MTENIPQIIKEDIMQQQVKTANSWRTVACNGILDLNPHFPKIEGQYYIVHQLDQTSAQVMSFHCSVVHQSWLIDNSMVSGIYPTMGLELTIHDREKMALFSAPLIMLSFIVKTHRRAIKLY